MKEYDRFLKGESEQEYTEEDRAISAGCRMRMQKVEMGDEDEDEGRVLLLLRWSHRLTWVLPSPRGHELRGQVSDLVFCSGAC